MIEKRLNNCVLLHVHKDLVDEINLVPIAKSFASLNSERINVLLWIIYLYNFYLVTSLYFGLHVLIRIIL